MAVACLTNSVWDDLIIPKILLAALKGACRLLSGLSPFCTGVPILHIGTLINALGPCIHFESGLYFQHLLEPLHHRGQTITRSSWDLWSLASAFVSRISPEDRTLVLGTWLVLQLVPILSALLWVLPFRLPMTFLLTSSPLRPFFVWSLPCMHPNSAGWGSHPSSSDSEAPRPDSRDSRNGAFPLDHEVFKVLGTFYF